MPNAESPKPKRFRIKRVRRKSGVIHEEIIIVDAEDASLLRSSYWSVASADNTGKIGYVVRHTPNGIECLHDIIAGTKEGERVVHINGNSMDNRRANLLKQSDRVEEIEE